MNPWIAFFLGMLWSAVSIGTVGGVLFYVASSTPQMALSSLAACLRGFARPLGALHVVVIVEGKPVRLPFEQIASAIEHAELSFHRCCDPPSKDLN